MERKDDAYLGSGPAGQASAELAVDNTGTDNTDTSQTDGFRAYAPAGAAMATIDEEEYSEDELGEDYEDELEAEGEDHEEVSPEAEEELDSTADRLREYAEEGFIDETVNTINSMYRQNVDNGKLEIGTYILEEVYKGDSDEAMSTNPQKHKTFSKVLQRTDLLVEPKTLGSWVRAAAVRKDFVKKAHVFPNLTTYHYVELATVPDYEARVRFARKAELEKLTVKALREAIRKENGKSKSETDQLKADMDASIRRSFDLSSDGDLTDFASDFDSVKKAYPPEKAMKLLPEVKQGLSNVRALENLLKAFHGSLRAVVNEAMEPLSD